MFDWYEYNMSRMYIFYNNFQADMVALKYLLFLAVFKFAFQLDERISTISTTDELDDIDNISDGAENRVIPSDSEKMMTIDNNNSNDDSAKKSEQEPGLSFLNSNQVFFKFVLLLL